MLIIFEDLPTTNYYEYLVNRLACYYENYFLHMVEMFNLIFLKQTKEGIVASLKSKLTAAYMAAGYDSTWNDTSNEKSSSVGYENYYQGLALKHEHSGFNEYSDWFDIK